MKTAPGRRPAVERMVIDELGDDHPVTLKVMRLSKPNLRTQPPSLGQDCVPSMLILPKSGAAAYVGQTFASYLCVSNKSNGPVRNVALTAELEVGGKRFVLSDQRIRSGGMTEEEAMQLNRTDYLSNTNNQLLLMLVGYELAEASVHLLRVRVEYDGWRAGERKLMNKFYRFKVKPPLSFDFKLEEINCGSGSPHTLLCRIQVRNLTGTEMVLSEVSLIPTELITATLVVDDNNSGSPYSGNATSLPPLLKPDKKYSKVYKIEAKNPQAILQPGVANLGRVVVKWNIHYCEPGRIVSQAVLWNGVKDMQRRGDIRVRLCAEETRLVVGQQYKVVMEVHNQGNTAIHLTFDVRQDEDDSRNYLISGPTRVDLGQLAAGTRLDHTFDILPIHTGSCQVDAIYVKVAGKSPQEIQVYSSFWTKQRLQLQVVGSL